MPLRNTPTHPPKVAAHPPLEFQPSVYCRSIHISLLWWKRALYYLLPPIPPCSIAMENGKPQRIATEIPSGTSLLLLISLSHSRNLVEETFLYQLIVSTSTNALIMLLEIRLVLVGPHASGKTAFRRTLQGKPFKTTHSRGFLRRYGATVDIESEKVPIQVWEASEESAASLQKLLVDIYVLVIDGSSSQSLSDIEKTDVRTYNSSQLSHESRKRPRIEISFLVQKLFFC